MNVCCCEILQVSLNFYLVREFELFLLFLAFEIELFEEDLLEALTFKLI